MHTSFFPMSSLHWDLKELLEEDVAIYLCVLVTFGIQISICNGC